LTDKVVLVTGASRGVGKGIAIAFARAGATVYLTPRTRHDDASTLPGSIEETAAAVVAAGGRSVAIACDHNNDEQVRNVFERIEREAGRLDVLVNNACALPAALVGGGGFWERSLELAQMFDVGLRSTYVATWYAAPMMVRRRSGLIVNVSFYGAVSYFHGPAYGAQKAGGDKMMHDMAVELAPYNVAALSLWPGRVRTELNTQRWQGTQGAEARLAQYESPEFSGLVLEALSRDPNLMTLSGRSIIGAEYALAHGIHDIDGKQPRSLRAEFGPSPIYCPSDIIMSV
jgi:NAD(P)-dependent dehydrogenase (short-subunit alcohol dehydrogenase family)